jgi:tetratricopeptide (TPR) repeat protein
MIRAALIFGFVCLFAAPVGAQPTTAQERELAEMEARALFSAAVAAYDAGRYEDALDSFERAYARSGRAELLFNVGQCLDRLRRDEEAVDAFERFLAAMPNAENRAQVEARIRALREGIARRDAPPVSPSEVASTTERAAPADPLRDESPHRGRRIALITTSAVVVVAAVVLTVVLVRADDGGFARSDIGTIFARVGR